LITRVLVANRGEIAVRVIRACHEEGIAAVAVYSEPDRLAPHVRDADAAVLLGAAPAAESYLDIKKLITAAKESGCQAVHPGYGFLSERAAFAQACDEAELVFIGPPAQAIRVMGDKTEARRRMQAAGVPVVPGTAAPLRDPVEARREAKRIGYPVLLKAAAGGGGKGMRLVRGETDVEEAFQAARREALKAFGDGSIYVEKYLERPRHIEIQVLADRHGRVIALGERDDAAMTVRQHLDLDVPRSLQILLDVDAAIAECFQGFPTRRLKPCFDLRLRAHQPHAFAAASRYRFQHHGITDPFCFAPCLDRIPQRRRGPRDNGHAGGLHAAARFGLVAHHANRLSRRTDEHEFGFVARLRKRGALREKAVTRMHRLAATLLRCGDELLDVEVGFRRRCCAEQDGRVGITHVRREAVRLRVHGDRCDAFLMARADHPNRDLAAISDEDARDQLQPTAFASPNVSNALHSAETLLTARR